MSDAPSTSYLAVDRCTGVGIPLEPDDDLLSPARLLFQLGGPEGLHLWEKALRPKSSKGDGHCEQLALKGDAYLKAVAMDVLLERFPDPRDATHAQQMCQSYISNAGLSRLDEILHIRMQVRGAKHRLSDREVGTIVEALIGACKDLRGVGQTEALVRKLMGLMDGSQESPIKCGDPLWTNWRGVTYRINQGCLSCCDKCPFADRDPRRRGASTKGSPRAREPPPPPVASSSLGPGARGEAEGPFEGGRHQDWTGSVSEEIEEEVVTSERWGRAQALGRHRELEQEEASTAGGETEGEPRAQAGRKSTSEREHGGRGEAAESEHETTASMLEGSEAWGPGRGHTPSNPDSVPSGSVSWPGEWERRVGMSGPASSASTSKAPGSGIESSFGGAGSGRGRFSAEAALFAASGSTAPRPSDSQWPPRFWGSEHAPSTIAESSEAEHETSDPLRARAREDYELKLFRTAPVELDAHSRDELRRTLARVLARLARDPFWGSGEP